MGEREKLFSVTIHDCEVQVFRAGTSGRPVGGDR